MTETDKTKATESKTESPLPVEAIEEDDEFEEFEPCRWDASEEDEGDSREWLDNWDDDDIDDDFTMHLRAELEKTGN